MGAWWGLIVFYCLLQLNDNATNAHCALSIASVYTQGERYQ